MAGIISDCAQTILAYCHRFKVHKNEARALGQKSSELSQEHQRIQEAHIFCEIGYNSYLEAQVKTILLKTVSCTRKWSTMGFCRQWFSKRKIARDIASAYKETCDELDILREVGNPPQNHPSNVQMHSFLGTIKHEAQMDSKQRGGSSESKSLYQTAEMTDTTLMDGAYAPAFLAPPELFSHPIVTLPQTPFHKPLPLPSSTPGSFSPPASTYTPLLIYHIPPNELASSSYPSFGNSEVTCPTPPPSPLALSMLSFPEVPEISPCDSVPFSLSAVSVSPGTSLSFSLSHVTPDQSPSAGQAVPTTAENVRAGSHPVCGSSLNPPSTTSKPRLRIDTGQASAAVSRHMWML